ncbi:hypothetical protein LJR027_003550 [Terrabacter sp. LjRoot27]|uniref:hypothetical protein n=1 Tax=Terrabacter sp. LjRoot27 TaxID=3342306 RepID=UPI003ECDE563
MPSPTTGTDRTKVLSVRLTAEELEALIARATEIGVGPSTLARTYVRHGLSGSPAGAGATTAPAAAPAASGSSAAPSSPGAGGSALETRLSAMLAEHAKADLESRVAALEKWVAEH